MNILLMNQSYYPNNGGIENSLYYISKALKEEGHEVTIYTAAYNKNQKLNEVKEGVTITRYPYYLIAKRSLSPIKPLVNMILVKLHLMKLCKKKSTFDLIISRDYQMSTASKNIFTGVRSIYIPPLIVKSYRDELLKKLKLRKFSFRNTLLIYLTKFIKVQESLLQNLTLKNTDKIVCFSENMKKQINIELNEVQNHIQVVPPGVDTLKFQPKGVEIPNSNELNSNNPEVPFLLYVGRLVPEKNLDLLLESIALSKKNFKLLVVGSGLYQRDLEEKIKNLELNDIVIFVGKSSNTNMYYNLAKFTILPSTYEAFGQVLIESLACATPCIAFESNFPKVKVASSEIIEDNKTGFLVENPSAELLAKSIDHAFSISEESYNLMKKNCIDKAIIKYDWNRFVREIME